MGTNRIDVDALALIYLPPLRLQPLLGSLRGGLETIGSIDDAGAVLVGEAHHSEPLIRNNRLDDADDAHLRHMAVIHIVPAGPQTK
jgi:hypothetical protein